MRNGLRDLFPAYEIKNNPRFGSRLNGRFLAFGLVLKLPVSQVALIMKSLANEFFQTMENGARDYQAQHWSEFALISNGIKNETDVSAQINLVDQMIAQHVDAIVMAPAASKALKAK